MRLKKELKDGQPPPDASKKRIESSARMHFLKKELEDF